MLPDPAGAEALLAAGAPVETLVPADLGGLRAAAGVLRSSAATLETAGHSLSRVEVTQWRGDASTAFADRISVEPGRWRAASDAFSGGAAALERYADDVVAARSTAAEAVEVYRSYCSAVVAVATAAGGVAGPVVGGAMGVGMRAVQLRSAVDAAATSVDPSATARVAAQATAADDLQRRALELVDRARTAVTGAARVAAAAFVAAASEAPEARQFWESSIRPAGATGAGHTALDTVGLLPAVGDPADGVNALWYARDGDFENAGMSAVGLVPLVGEYVILQKFGRQILVRDGVVQGGRAGADILGRDTLRLLGDGGLLAHEFGEDFHTIARHVGRSDEQLTERLIAESRLSRASTFTTLEDAERYTYANLAAHQAEIEAFRGSERTNLRIEQTFDHSVGRTMVRPLSAPVDATTVVTLLRKDPTMPHGYRIATSFPQVR